MQIRTALAIGVGIAIGTIAGMGVSDKAKEKAILSVKKSLIYALTGEKWQPKRKQPYEKMNYVAYNQLNKHDHEKIYKINNDAVHTVLEFDSEKDARKCIDEVHAYLEKYLVISVHDLGFLRKMEFDYTTDLYGWTRFDWEKVKPIPDFVDEDKWTIDIKNPMFLDGIK